jgi:hypothetical protein
LKSTTLPEASVMNRMTSPSQCSVIYGAVALALFATTNGWPLGPQPNVVLPKSLVVVVELDGWSGSVRVRTETG